MTINAPSTVGTAPLSQWSDRSPDPSRCLNCGALRAGEYCGECGQRDIEPRPTMRELLHEVAEELLGWDGTLVRTFRLLIAKPGALTKEYLAGKRASYISPLRVYLACSVIAFFVAAVTPDPPARMHNGQLEQVGQGQLVADKTLGVNLKAEPTTTSGAKRGMDAAIRRSFARAQVDKAGFRAKVADAVPTLLFVLVPLLAVLVGLGFRTTSVRVLVIGTLYFFLFYASLGLTSILLAFTY